MIPSFKLELQCNLTKQQIIFFFFNLGVFFNLDNQERGLQYNSNLKNFGFW